MLRTFCVAVLSLSLVTVADYGFAQKGGSGGSRGGGSANPGGGGGNGGRGGSGANPGGGGSKGGSGANPGGGGSKSGSVASGGGGGKGGSVASGGGGSKSGSVASGGGGSKSGSKGGLTGVQAGNGKPSTGGRVSLVANLVAGPTRTPQATMHPAAGKTTGLTPMTAGVSRIHQLVSANGTSTRTGRPATFGTGTTATGKPQSKGSLVSTGRATTSTGKTARVAVTLAHPARYPQPMSAEQKKAWAMDGVQPCWDPVTGFIGFALGRAFNLPTSPGIVIGLGSLIRDLLDTVGRPPARSYFESPSYWSR
jgi:hypothetical protein